MEVDFPNYVGLFKLPSSKALYPLFEAISNSIDAIQEKNSNGNGYIKVIIERENQTTVDAIEDSHELLPIKNISIEDDGVGFRDTNFKAFSKINTAIKKSRGGRGVGRVSWLKAFEYAEIESTYSENGNKKYRHFEFRCDNTTIHPIDDRIEESLLKDRTLVRLINCKAAYQDSIPKRGMTIAEEIVTHFLPYFVMTNIPKIVLIENDADDINLDNIYELFISEKAIRDKFEISGNIFDVVHTKTKYDSQKYKNHKVYYVAHGRVVESKIITSEKVLNLPPKIQVDEDDYVYIGYIESEYLNQNVNQSRFDFDIPKSNEDTLQISGIDWKSIEDSVHLSIAKFLNPYLEKARLEKETKIIGFINNKAPSYSYLYKYHKEKLDKIRIISIKRGRAKI
ncbi:MAG: ATP-binding protein [Anaerolineaceae bacterium]|nr:ATP-binding protein [Anaerolineaceae bacterium]